MADSILYIEPFYGGSHKQLVDLLQREFGGTIYSLPPTKWHWSMRTSALYFTQILPHPLLHKILFISSVLNLCELIGLRSDLRDMFKILYFHENQLVYPVRKHQDRDFQYGYNQILSCLVADCIVFNSRYNMNTFLTNIDSFLKLSPNLQLQGIADQIQPKCHVLYFPLQIPIEHFYIISSTCVQSTCEPVTSVLSTCDSPVTSVPSTCEPVISLAVTSTKCLHIVWPHRWEHDKGPEELCSVVQKLLDNDMEFCLSILGAHTNDIPNCFIDMFKSLGSKLLHKGSVDKDTYWNILSSADIVLSTAKHEFYGVSMLEATCCGCFPLCPSKLVYTEIYPTECLYNTEQQLFKKLKSFCAKPYLAKHYRNKMSLDTSIYQWSNLQQKYKEIFIKT